MIRGYKPEDLPVIMDIGNRAWRGIYAMYRETYGEELFGLLTPEPTAAKGIQIKSHCEQHPEWVFVCEEQGDIAGFITFRIDSATRIGEIGNNAVDPDCAVKGIGQQMYQAVFEFFRTRNVAYARVSTGTDYAHTAARRAYERAGFTIRHEDVTYYKKL